MEVEIIMLVSITVLASTMEMEGVCAPWSLGQLLIAWPMHFPSLISSPLGGNSPL
jgi:hypothetical protein